MALTQLTPEKVRAMARAAVDEDEEILCACFGMRVPRKSTSRKILIFGVVVIGLLILQMLQDKVLVVLTKERLVVVVLYERILTPAEVVAFDRDRIEDAAVERGSMYVNVDLVVAGKPMRFKFFPTPMGYGENAAQLDVLEAELTF